MRGYAGIWSLMTVHRGARFHGAMTASAVPNRSLTTLEFVRRTAGMSRPHLAERSGVSVATILASERFGRVPHLSTARRLADALNLAVDELFPEGEQNGWGTADHAGAGFARGEGRRPGPCHVTPSGQPTPS